MGLFDVLTDPIENVLDVGTGLLQGDMPSRRQLAELINDGISVAAIANTYGVSVEMVRALIEQDD